VSVASAQVTVKDSCRLPPLSRLHLMPSVRDKKHTTGLRCTCKGGWRRDMQHVSDACGR